MGIDERMEMRAGTRGRCREPCRAYKSAVTYAINKSQNSRGSVIWQRNYYEHVIRDERELDLIARYIHYNPFNWQVDCDNPENTRKLPAPESVEDYLRDAEEILGVKIK